MSLGPFATWDLIRKISASIPCQRKIKDHVETEINHFFRGKSHTSPDAEEDIQNLQTAYHTNTIHTYTAGRKLNSKDKSKDYMMFGVEGTKLKKTIIRWAANRVSVRATGEDWECYGAEVV
jgi:hypothetical protein